MKRVVYITDAKLVPATDRWPNHENMAGKFYISAKVVVDTAHSLPQDGPVHTGPVISVDTEASVFETQNSVYIIIPESEVDSYRMTVV